MPRPTKQYRYDPLVREATRGMLGDLYLRTLQDRVEQRRVLAFRMQRTIFVALVFLVFVFDVDAVVLRAIGVPSEALAIARIFMLAVLIGVMVWYRRRYEEPKIRKFLGKLLTVKGVRPRFCLKCDYDLRGSDSTSCPECGTVLAPVDPQANNRTGI